MKIIISGILLLIPSFNSMADDLPDLPEPVPIEINEQDIVDALLDGNFSYAINQIENILLQNTYQKLADEKYIAKLVIRLAEKLKEVINDESKTDRKKKEDILRIIDQSMSSHASSPNGDLNLAFKHSIEYGVTRLQWDHNIVVDSCEGVFCGFVCETWTPENGCTTYSWQCEYWTDYIKRVPDFYIYRQVDGVESLITKLKGSKFSQRHVNLSISSNVFNSIKSIYEYYTDNFEIDVPDGKAFWYDFNSDYRNVGESLSYRVVADNTPYLSDTCNTRVTKQSTSSVDSDGDGKADFIPQSEYDALFGKYYGWLVPVITLMQ